MRLADLPQANPGVATMTVHEIRTTMCRKPRKERPIFTRILCGVDQTPESIEAVRQARRLATPATELLLVGVVESTMAVHGGWAAPSILEELREGELDALDRAKIAAGPHVRTRLLDGVPWSAIARAAEEEEVDLVAVGMHEHRRSAGIVGGSVATYVLHEAQCSVLVARSSESPEEFPRSVVAGFDGSQCGAEALALARSLAEEARADVRVVAAAGGQKLALEPVRELAPDAVVDHRPPVEALVAASEDADLLVLGSRGLHGLAAVGSVSERVAHQAKSSVLVVRGERPER
jgi:nucleotide-binding universal stress UspA family protein